MLESELICMNCGNNMKHNTLRVGNSIIVWDEN